MTILQIWFRRLILADILLFIIVISIAISPLSPSYSEFDFVLEKGLIGSFLDEANPIYSAIYYSLLLAVSFVSWILLYRFHWTGRPLFIAIFVFAFADVTLSGDSVENGLVSAVESLLLMLEGAMFYMMYFTDLRMQFARKNTVSLPIERP